MSFKEILINDWEIVAPAGETILGFVSDWIIFILQARRKERNAAQPTRQSLVEELKWLEVQLSFAVIKCAHQSDIVDRGVKEFRWVFKEGFSRVKLQEFTPEQLKIECIEPLGLTVTEAAKRLGVRRQILNNLVNGKGRRLGRDGRATFQGVRIEPGGMARPADGIRSRAS